VKCEFRKHEIPNPETQTRSDVAPAAVLEHHKDDMAALNEIK
jgi:hypothetical protein